MVSYLLFELEWILEVLKRLLFASGFYFLVAQNVPGNPSLHFIWLEKAPKNTPKTKNKKINL